MASLVDYKGLQVVSPEPTGDGGLAIQDDLKSLVDWNPRSVWAQTDDPTATNDEAQEFYPGSMWLRTDVTPPKLFVCRSSAASAAVWSQVALTANAVPYSGATGNVNLGAYYLSARGIVAGFSASNPNVAARLTNYWFPRDADISTGWMFDYQDEFAVRHLKGATVSVSPSPSSGVGNNLLIDNTDYIQYTSGTSPGTIVIEVDTSSNPVQARGNGFYAVGLTFRSYSASANPTHIKIEYQAPSTSYATVYDEDVTQVGGFNAWVSPIEAPPEEQSILSKVRVTLTVPTPLPANFRLQRLAIYHSTAPFDPWHLHVLGGSVYGPVGVGTTATSSLLQVGGAIATAISTTTANATLGASDSVVLVDAEDDPVTITLPTAVGISGRQYTVKRLNDTGDDVTIATTSSQTIDELTTKVLGSQYEKVTVASDGANWWIVG